LNLKPPSGDQATAGSRPVLNELEELKLIFSKLFFFLRSSGLFQVQGFSSLAVLTVGSFCIGWCLVASQEELCRTGWVLWGTGMDKGIKARQRGLDFPGGEMPGALPFWVQDSSVPGA
jgi:hypothetical protein